MRLASPGRRTNMPFHIWDDPWFQKYGADLNISFDEVAEAVFPRKERYDYDDSRL